MKIAIADIWSSLHQRLLKSSHPDQDENDLQSQNVYGYFTYSTHFSIHIVHHFSCFIDPLEITFFDWLVGWVLWHINHCRLFKAKSSLYIYIKYIWFALVGFYGMSTIVGYLMLNPVYTYLLDIYDLVWLGFMAYQPWMLFKAKSSLYIYIKYIWFALVGFYGISTIVGYLRPNPLYTYILNIWFGLVGFYGISTIVGYLRPNPLYTYILNIWFGLVGFYGISTIVGYLMLNPLYTYLLDIYDLVWLGFMAYQPWMLFKAKSSLYIYIKYIWFALVGFYGISTIVGYLRPNPLYTYILDIYGGVWLGLWHINHCMLLNAKSYYIYNE